MASSNWLQRANSLLCETQGDDFKCVILQQIAMFDAMNISCEIASGEYLMASLIRSTLIQIIAWCQCWSNSLSPYDFTRPHLVNKYWPAGFFFK